MTSGKARAWAVLAVLTAMNLLNFADRYVLGGLQELLKHDASLVGGPRDATGALTDTALGSLTTAFVLVFMLASPIAGFLGDRAPRRFLVAGGAIVWSLATFLSGIAHDFTTLLAARALIGVGEAGYATVAPAVVADLFEPKSRTRALGVFCLVMPLGAALGFGIGAAVGSSLGWRHAFWVAGAPGFLLGLVALFLPEPARGAQDAEKPGEAHTFKDTARALFANREWLVNTLGQTLMTFTLGGLANWMPSFLSRDVGVAKGEAGTLFGAATAIAGLLGTGLGIVLGEKLGNTGKRGIFALSGTGLVLAAPCLAALAFAEGKWSALAFAFLAMTFILVNTAPLATHLVTCVPAELRASSTAWNVLAIHLFGDAAAPLLVGAVSDAADSLALAVGLTALPLVAGGLVFLWGARAKQAAPALET